MSTQSVKMFLRIITVLPQFSSGSMDHGLNVVPPVEQVGENALLQIFFQFKTFPRCFIYISVTCFHQNPP